MKMKLRDAILAGNATAVGDLADRIRMRGGKYTDVAAAVRKIYAEAKRTEPSDAQLDAWLYESEIV